MHNWREYRGFASRYAKRPKHGNLLCAIFINFFFSHDFSRAIQRGLRKRDGNRGQRWIWPRWKKLSTVLKISLQWNVVSEREMHLRSGSEFSRSRCRTAWRRQIMRGVRRCILFMQIFMKFSWSGCDTTREVRAMSSRACPWSTDTPR